ncbi:hypothetical protein N1F89_05485 [Aquibium sp. A9E412]|uniref:hypothetical protein n=1 Tax=Aquibium sp. A9E412 TaxID=2976767 RepID=UPI0025B25552|nr:hypothetical protein [Aquibium sp. A9E412]MDN2565667.1 hypothetical protein [Aquibium sp. A9E412]
MPRPAVLAAAVTALAASPVAAADITSAYTEIDAQTSCVVYAAAAADEGGDWASLACAGYRGYPVLIAYGDARESVFYGFPPAGGGELEWESFAGFNRTGPTVEWRLWHDGDSVVPFAAIHRWFVVADPQDPEAEVEVLVVEKVGQPDRGEGCAVGYVVATGNAGANEAARRIADNQVHDFACGADQPVIDAGDVPVPAFTGFGG